MMTTLILAAALAMNPEDLARAALALAAAAPQCSCTQTTCKQGCGCAGQCRDACNSCTCGVRWEVCEDGVLILFRGEEQIGAVNTKGTYWKLLKGGKFERAIPPVPVPQLIPPPTLQFEPVQQASACST